MTTVQDFITNLNGTPANGRLVINSPPMTVGGVAVAASQIFADIVEGAVDVDVYSNLNAQPTGVYYTVYYELDQGPVYEENWIVPNLPQVNIGQIRAAFPLTPSIMINAQQLTSAGALPGQFLGWSGANWTPMYVTSFNYYPNFIGLNVTKAAAPDLAVTGSPASLGSNLTLNVPDAALTSRGVVNTGAQTFGGNKTFENNVTVVGSFTGAGMVVTDLTVTGQLLATGTSNMLIDPTTTLGDLIARPATGAPQRFGAGANGMILTADSTQPLGLRWGPGPLVDPTTNLGDLIVRSAGAVARLGVGTNGQALVANSVQPLGMNWAAVVNSVFGRTGVVVAASGDYTAAQVTNAVSILGSYADPPWITSLSWSKITGVPAAGVSSVFTRTGAVVAQAGDYTAAQVTNAVSTIGSYSDPAWITGLAWAKILNPPPLFGDPTTTKGDLIVHGTSTTRLPVGTDNWVLTADSTQTLGVRWAPVATGGGAVTSVFGRTGAVIAVAGDYSAAMVSNAVDATQTYSNPAFISTLAWSKITGAPTFMADPTTTKGDLIVHGTTTTRLPVGSDGQILTADSTQALGVKWAPPIVASVFGRTGAVVAQAGDYTAAQITNAVDSTQTYNNPAWINTLAWSKITGTPTIYVDPLTTKGDILGHGTVTTRIPVGTDGWVLTADSTQGLGVKWAAVTGGSGSQSPWTSNIVGAGFQLQNAGNIGIGTSTIPLQTPVAGRLYLTIKGSTDAGVLELATGSADADATILGRIAYTDPANNQTDKRAAFIDAYRQGSVVNNRGSLLAFWTRPDGGTTPTEQMVLTNAGRLGVGNLTPAYMADIAGDVSSTGCYRINGNAFACSDGASGVNLSNVTTINGAAPGGFWQAGSAGAIYYSGGNVGIGTSTPTASLQVSSASPTIALIGNPAGPVSLDLICAGGSTGGSNSISGNLTISGGAWALRNASCDGWLLGMGVNNTANGSLGVWHMAANTTTLVMPFIIQANGNVGIGTTAPVSSLLQVGANSGTTWDQDIVKLPGDIIFSGYSAASPNVYLEARDTSGTNSIGFVFRTSNAGVVAERVYFTAAGNVGIGTATPATPLHVVSAAVAAGSDDFILKVQNPNTAADARAGIFMHVNALTGTGSAGGCIESTNDGSGSAHILFGPLTGGSFVEKMRLTSAGNVGIGTVPAYALDVVGTCHASGIFYTTAKANYFGTASGPVANAAPSDANILLYNFASNNWAGIGIDSNGSMWFHTAGWQTAPGLILSNAGNVGVAGVSLPQSPLHVNIGSPTSMPALGSFTSTGINFNVGGSYGLTVTVLSSGCVCFQSQYTQGTTTPLPMALQPNGGALAIGKAVPAYSFDVVGDCNISGVYRVNGTPISTGGPTTWASYNSSQRPNNTTFTNNTGKPLYVSVYTSGATITSTVYVNGGVVGIWSTSATYLTVFFIVLPGMTYSVNSSGSFQTWYEWN